QFRVGIRKFTKWYSYLTQITRLFDEPLHKEFIFAQYLEKFIPKVKRGSVDLNGVLQLEYYSLKETFKGDLSLGVDETEPELKETKAGYESNKPEEVDETLENIIKAVN